MARITAGQIVNYAWNAGFRGGNLTRAVTVALAESGGPPYTSADSEAVSPTGCCYGLWQINIRAHPQYTREQMFDPQQNANAAFAIHEKEGWGAWNPSLIGQAAAGPSAAVAIQAFLAHDPSKKLEETKGPVKQQLGGVSLGPLDPLITAYNNIGAWISTPGNWFRVAEVIVGGGIILVAIAAVSRPVTEPIVRTAAQVSPYGRVGGAWFKGRK